MQGQGLTSAFAGRPFVVCDFDGVLTSMSETPGSFINHPPSGYGPSSGPVALFAGLLRRTGAVAVVSSNWRKFDESGPLSLWSGFPNPMPRLRAALGPLYACALPPCRGMRKPQALAEWFRAEGLDPASARYAVLDDDPREGFESSVFAPRFVMTDPATGLTAEDCAKAEALLAGGGVNAAPV